MFESAWRDVRYALRALRRDPRPTAVAVLTLALALGINTAVFSVVDAVLLRPLPVRDQERLVVLWEQERLRGYDLTELVSLVSACPSAASGRSLRGHPPCSSVRGR